MSQRPKSRKVQETKGFAGSEGVNDDSMSPSSSASLWELSERSLFRLFMVPVEEEEEEEEMRSINERKTANPHAINLGI